MRSRPGVAYWMVGAGLAIYSALAGTAHHWTVEDDGWEHVAVLRELSRRPFHPASPFIAGLRYHAFFNPYAVVLGIVGWILGLSPYGLLIVGAIINIALLVVVLPRFVRLFSSEPYAPLLVLVFALVLWGRSPWIFSGFIHLATVGDNAGFPSTLAIPLTMAAIVWWADYLDSNRLRCLLGVGVCAALLLLVHPVTMPVLIAGLAAFALPHVGRRELIVGAAVVAAALMLAFLWPYFPMARLIGSSREYDGGAYAMYERVLPRMWPIFLLSAPAVFGRLRRRPIDPLVVFLAILVVPYVLGGLTERWNLARVIAFAGLLLDVAAAETALWLARRATRRTAAAAATLVVCVVAVAVGLFGPRDVARNTPGVVAVGEGVRALRGGMLSDVPVISRVIKPAPHLFSDYPALLANVPRADTVMATAPDGWGVPAEGGPHVVATYHPQAFIKDNWIRLHDAARFFRPGTSPDVQRALLSHYGARWILVNMSETPSTEIDELARLGVLHGRSGTHLLIEARL